MIQPGLERITRLLAPTPLTWKAIHVAGTNGKGSICAAISHMLHASGLRCGRFTSPHLIDRWDCININEAPVSASLFAEVEADVQQYNATQQIEASEFELLTATAFRIFNRAELDFAVVEVGMGGLLDATNVLTQTAVSVISKIGIDHQNFLGDSLEAIAAHKAGIIKPSVPCIVDATNPASVLAVIHHRARALHAPVLLRSSLPHYSSPDPLWTAFTTRPHPAHHATNLALAYQALVSASLSTNRPPPSPSILGTLPPTHWPGRTQYLSLEALTARRAPVLLDGAHNPDSATVLGKYLPRDPAGRRVTWLLSMSAGKDAAGILRPLVRAGDAVVAVKFGAVDGMPWVRAMEPRDLLAAVREVAAGVQVVDAGEDVLGALRMAVEIADGAELVVTGSLYLVSDVLRLRRDRAGEGLEQPVQTYDPSLFDGRGRTWHWD